MREMGTHNTQHMDFQSRKGFLADIEPYYISLGPSVPKSAPRYHDMNEQSSRLELGLSFFKGTDGQTVSPDLLDRKLPCTHRNWRLNISQTIEGLMGEQAVFVSHMELFHHFLSTSNKTYLAVWEDDQILQSNVFEQIHHAVTSCPKAKVFNMDARNRISGQPRCGPKLPGANLGLMVYDRDVVKYLVEEMDASNANSSVFLWDAQPKPVVPDQKCPWPVDFFLANVLANGKFDVGTYGVSQGSERSQVSTIP